MEIVVNHLVFLFLYLLFTVKASNFSQEINTYEFDDHIQTHINDITKEPHRRYRLKKSFHSMKKEATLQFNEGYKKGYTDSFDEGYKKGFTESIESHFTRHFECAFEEWKCEMERIYQRCMPLPTKFSNTTQPIPEIPNDIVSISLDDDEWTYKKIKNESWILTEEEVKKSRLYELKIRYENWFRIITRRDPEMPYFIMLLQEKLVQLEAGNEGFYRKNGGIFARFAAKIARSFQIACAVCHFLGKKIERNLKTNEHEFHNELFHSAETWNMDNETLSYINLLRFSHYVSPPSKLSTIEDFDKIQCLNAWNNKLKKAVCMPYLISKECKQVNANLGNFIEGGGYNPKWRSESWLLHVPVGISHHF